MPTSRASAMELLREPLEWAEGVDERPPVGRGEALERVAEYGFPLIAPRAHAAGGAVRQPEAGHAPVLGMMLALDPARRAELPDERADGVRPQP